MNKPLVLAITGASGAIYATRLLQILLDANQWVHLVISSAGRQVLRHELDIDVEMDPFDPHSLFPGGLKDDSRLTFHRHDDFMAPIASGSYRTAGMVICPCSGGTLAGVVHGTSSNLIQRAADVHLKEGRKLILVPRETPLSLIQLENMKHACQAGAVILPATPGWYHRVTSIEDLVDFVVARILDQLEIDHQLVRRWGEGNPA